MKVIAVVGISGVGKSTRIRKWAENYPFVHLQASSLIKTEQAALKQTVASSEELRLGPVLDNQTLLVNAFKKAVDGYRGLVIFDGHTLIDGLNGPVPIPSNVFSELGCRHVIFVHDTSSAIVERRLADRTRDRPRLSADDLARHQDFALATARDIAAKLGIGLTVLSHAAIDGFNLEGLVRQLPA